MGGNVGDDDGTSRTPIISLPALACVSLRYPALPCLALLCLSFSVILREIMHISYCVYPASLEERPMKTLETMRSTLPNTDQCFPRAVITPQPPLETVDSLSDYGFLASTCGYTSKIIERPPCRANTATRASSSPELRDQSFTFAGVPPFTRASSSPELYNQRSPFSEHHLQQSVDLTCASRPELLLHGDSSSRVVT